MRSFINIIETAQVDPELKAWFGNGIITDADYEPLLIHHFTYNDFEKFDRMWAANFFKRDPEGIDTLGIWFTMNDQAYYVSSDPAWGDGKRMDCYVRVKKAKFYDDGEPQNVATSAWMQLFNDIKEVGGATAMRAKLKASGYDCVILLGTFLDGYRQTVVIVLDEDDIRIAHRHSTAELEKSDETV